MDKSQIRSLMRKKLNSQSKEDIRRKSSKILKKLLGLKEFKNSKTVGFFLSKPNEVDSTITFQSILGTKEFSVPVMDDGIKLVSFNSFENLIVGDYDILEPKERSYLDYVPELLVIPGVAFDLDRNRLGNGKGFYDRFLEGKDTYKIALAFDFQIMDKISSLPHDVKMDVVITEERIL